MRCVVRTQFLFKRLQAKIIRMFYSFLNALRVRYYYTRSSSSLQRCVLEKKSLFPVLNLKNQQALTSKSIVSTNIVFTASSSNFNQVWNANTFLRSIVRKPVWRERCKCAQLILRNNIRSSKSAQHEINRNQCPKESFFRSSPPLWRRILTSSPHRGWQ